MENLVKNENYATIAGWMVKELQLKGNELIIYSIIYGFSQTSGQVFNGSLQYLADWTNSTKQGVIKALKSLEEKGYINKNEIYRNGVKFCEYYSTKFNTLLNKVEYPIKQSLTNNIINNIENNIEIERKKGTTSYDDIIHKLVKDIELSDLIYEFIKMRKLIKKPMTDRALEMMINKLNKLGSSLIEQKKILENSITNSWQDIYPIKEDFKTTKKQEPKKLLKTEYSKEFMESLDSDLDNIII